MGRKQKTSRKPRTDRVYGTTVGEVNELILHVDESTGEFSFGNEMTNVYAESSYERAKGPKAIFRVPQSGKNLTFDIEKMLIRDFDYLCAVDTNTQIVNNKRISAVGVLNFRHFSIPGPKDVQKIWRFDSPFGIEFVEVKSDKIENMCWLAVYDELLGRGIISPETRVGMVVDSDLGNLNDYNHRRKPFFKDFYMPAGLKLIYASADTGKDNVLNHALNIADSISSQTIAAVKNGLVAFNHQNLEYELYEGIRIIVPRITERIK